ncbi:MULTISPECIES: hypothetical protein [Streptomyces]|uniref:Uncharacterized protein n=1 Tax=Streptomyces morookaense TaxID=1970 RepID=A0A7Y7AZN4_STRMO|nr:MULTISPECIES: hypothetical protein [Streptomyces]MCC2276944.1 hypothetical protein [Streptomyces sp. ET3-23]NVK76119.1 hypothetical protein [Streptomyces morookaense]
MTSVSTHKPIPVPAHVARQRRIVLGLFISACVVLMGATVLSLLLLLNGTLE